MTAEFQGFPKIARLNRDIIITEKIDGTNAAIGITEDGEVYAQSRSRIITPEQDNFGFAKWVSDHAEAILTILPVGLHFGEWWGQGIQRGYGLDHKVFSLFNVASFASAEVASPFWSAFPHIRTVPILYEGPMSTVTIENALDLLRTTGSRAAPGFMKPEGIVVYHTAARQMFKVTLEGDEKPKGSRE